MRRSRFASVVALWLAAIPAVAMAGQMGAGTADPHRTALALRDLAARLRDRAPEAAEAMASAAAALDALAAPVIASGAATRRSARRPAGS